MSISPARHRKHQKKEKEYIPPTGITDSLRFKMRPLEVFTFNPQLVTHKIDQEDYTERQPRANKIKEIVNQQSLANIDSKEKIRARKDLFDAKQDYIKKSPMGKTIQFLPDNI